MSFQLYLPRSIAEELASRAATEVPLEACGLLGGVEGRVLAHYPGTNIARSPVRYEMDPDQVVMAMQDILERGWDLAAVYHSHPDGPSGLSATDLRLAFYPEAAYVVVSPGPGGEWRLRAFQVAEGGVSELEVMVEG